MRVCAIVILVDIVVVEREERVLKAFLGKKRLWPRSLLSVAAGKLHVKMITDDEGVNQTSTTLRRLNEKKCK